MAFTTAAGYTNLPSGNFSPTIYSKKVQKQFRKKTIMEAITNSDYFGEIKNFGDTVRIIKEPEITIVPYARGTQLTPQDLQDTDFTLTVDRANAFMYQIDDIEKQQSHVNWMDMAADRASYKMQEKYDADILAYMSGYERDQTAAQANTWVVRTAAVGTNAETSAGTDELLSIHKLTRADFVSGGSSSSSVACGVSGTFDVTPLQILNRMNRLLDLQNTPKDGRYIVIDPVFAEILMDENSKFINNDYNPGSKQLTNGKLVDGMIRGFEVYLSNSLPFVGTGPSAVASGGSTSNYGIIVAGQKQAVATAQQLDKVESYRSQNSFSDIVRGMHLYGRKILRPQGLVRAWYNINQ